ncbi:hypothetical protein BFS16_12390 [Hoylesella timonensis]|uniref:YubB ferredoxin-like domain-containing protein n=1 Tax=Hoylesella timonensis TaxID=386414 RepID=A0A2K0X8Y5_9BACT|nr:hypothetical protein [Hoylesella timonensis]PNP90995.1 hypothetical protein BFS16_12390 [Hoylesella timonensis]
MANWASTSYRIEGSKEDLEKVYNVIDEFMSERRKPVQADASNEWEGNIIRALGATDEQMKNNYLRGFIEEYEMDGDIIRIEAEEAWGTTDFRHVLAQLMPELTIYYIVEEPGCEVYATNDADGKYFPERFYVDAYVNGDYQSEYFDTEEQAMTYVANLLGKKEVSKNELENWNEYHEEDNNFIYIHEFEIVEC